MNLNSTYSWLYLHLAPASHELFSLPTASHCLIYILANWILFFVFCFFVSVISACVPVPINLIGFSSQHLACLSKIMCEHIRLRAVQLNQRPFHELKTRHLLCAIYSLTVSCKLYWQWKHLSFSLDHLLMDGRENVAVLSHCEQIFSTDSSLLPGNSTASHFEPIVDLGTHCLPPTRF